MGTFKENKINFTKTSTNSKIAYYYDKQVSGLGIMVFTSGTKTFFLYRRVQGRPDKIKLERFPEMSVEQARKKAYSIIGEIDKGIDPKAEKQKATKDVSFSELFTEFMEKHSKLHKRSWKDDENKFKLHFQHFAKRKISLITKADIIQLQTTIAKDRGIYSANGALRLLSTISNKAISWGWEGRNPCIGIKKFKEQSRDRFIQGDETKRFFEALDAEPNEMLKDFFYILLLTGARKANVQSMNWNDVNFERTVWIIKETKNGEAMTVPLIPQAIGILERRYKDRLSDWVFPSATSKSGHLEEPKKLWKRLLKRACIKDLRIHDLRRTLGSWQAAIGANSYVIGKSLGHKTQSATAIYARLNLDPVRASVEKAVDATFVSAGKN